MYACNTTVYKNINIFNPTYIQYSLWAYSTVLYSRNYQGWEFAHSLIAHRSFAHSLISLKSNEQLWAIRSDRSRQMSNCEQIAQVAYDIWATVSDSLRSLMINERMSDSLKKIWLKNL